MINPKFIDTGPGAEDVEIQSKIRNKIKKLGMRNRGPILFDVFKNPHEFGVQNVVRQELMKVVVNSLEKAGFAGKTEDVLTEKRLAVLLKIQEQKENGGFF